MEPILQKALSCLSRRCLGLYFATSTVCANYPVIPNKGKKNRNPNSAAETEEANEQPMFTKPKFGGKDVKPSTPNSERNILNDLPPSMRSKYRLFTDESQKVLDSAQEQWVEIEPTEEEVDFHKFEGLSLERGKTGVFEIHEMIEVLRMENGHDICAIMIPPEVKYADYLVVVSARSSRHLSAMAQFVYQYYKAKKDPSDPFLTTNQSSWGTDWIAMDLGNIVVHFMERSVREKYDIESLWALGPEHDPLSQARTNSMVELVEKSSRIVGGTEEPVDDTKFGTLRLEKV